MRITAAVVLLVACKGEVRDEDGAFYDGDGRLVHCAVNLDERAGNSLGGIDAALDRAAERGEVVELYAHKPGETVPVAKIEHVLAGAVARGLPFVTYRDFAEGRGAGAGLALSFDDTAVDLWADTQPVFEQYGARVTFFVSRYHKLNAEQRGRLRELANEGHDVAAHGVDHQNAPAYVEEHGLAAYLATEAVPSIEVLRADGYEVTAFAYPFGARTSELDRGLAEYVPVLRSVAWTIEVTDPCP